MKKYKRQLLKISFIILFIFFLLGTNHNKIYASAMGSYSLSTQIGTMDNKQDDSNWANTYENRKLYNYVDSIDFNLTTSGTLTISTNSNWNVLCDESYVDGSDTYTYISKAGDKLTSSSENFSDGYDSETHTNYTNNLTDYGYNVYATINGTRKGAYLEGNSSSNIYFNQNLEGTVSIRFYLIWSYHYGYSYQYNQDRYEYYTIFWDFDIKLTDITAPTIKLNNSTTTDGTIFTSNPTAVVSDDEAISSWNYSKGSTTYSSSNSTIISDNSFKFSSDGYYMITAYDTSNNSSYIKFIVDTTKPTITGITNGNYYNTNKTLTFFDSTSGVDYVLINGSRITLDSQNKYTVSTSSYSGKITATVYDKGGLSTSVIFYIDTTDPTISGVSDGAIINSATINYSDNYSIASAKYSINSTTYNTSVTSSFLSGTTFNDEGYYYLQIIDISGRISNLKFRIDKTKPTISGVSDGESYNTNKTISFNDNSSIKKVLINSNEITLDSQNKYTVSTSSYSGNINVTVYDAADNISSLNFTLDIIEPTLSLTNHNSIVDNIYYCNDSISINSNEIVTYTINGINYPNRTTLTLYANNYEDKKYILTATDAAGNITTKSIYFDTTVPTISFKNATEYDDTYYYNLTETINISSLYSPISKIYYTYNGNTYEVESNKSSFNLEDPGSYTISVVTEAGNTSFKKLILDKTNPTLQIVSKGEILSSGDFTNTSFIVNYNDNVLLSNNVYYTFNSGDVLSFSSGDSFTEDGEYAFTVYDQAGNVITYQFYKETTKPTITGVTNGNYYNKSKVIYFDDDYDIDSVYINNTPVEIINYKFNLDPDIYYGEVEILTYDLAGNSNQILCYMDNKKPDVNVINNYHYANDFRITISDLLLDSKSYLIKDDTEKIYFVESSTNNINTLGDGKYCLYLVDKASNEESFTFYVDSQAPEGKLTGFTSSEQNKFRANSSCVLTFTFDKEESTAYFNNLTYTSGKIDIIASELPDGEYSIILEDQAGNSSEYILDLKSSIPIADINGYHKLLDDVYYANNESILEITWTDSTAKVIINNDEEFKTDFTIICSDYAEGTYELILIDEYNNYSKYNIIIDKESDKNNYNNLKLYNYSWINHWWNTYDYTYGDFNYTVANTYSFASLDAAEEFARIRENATYEKIQYTGQNNFESDKYGEITDYYDYENKEHLSVGDYVYIYKSLTSASKIVVYFNYANFNKALNYYISSSITEHYRYFTNNSNIATANDSNLYYNNFYISGSEYTLSKAENTTTIYTSTDGNKYIEQSNKATIYSGTNYIREIDIAGNITEYIIILNSEPITYNVLNNTSYTSQLNNTQTLYASSPIILQLNSKYPEHNIIKYTYTDLDNNISTNYIVDDGLNLENEGTYLIYTYDIFGNQSVQYKVYILYSDEYLPSITYETSKVDGLSIDLRFSISYYKLVNNQIRNILVKYTDRDGNSKYLSTDDKGNQITVDSTVLIFETDGSYEVSITDIFGNDATAFETLQVNTPFGQLFAGNPGYAVPSGTITNQSIYFSYNTEYQYTCLLNGANYIQGTAVSKEGVYEFVLSNASYSSTYIVEIDKTAATGKFLIDNIEVENNKTTSSENVIFIFDEKDATATINNVKIKSNSLISKEGKNTILLEDKAGNIAEYNITIDKTAPQVIIYSGNNQVENGAIVNERIRFIWDEIDCTAYLNGILYTSGRYISTPGVQILVIQDKYGNSAEYVVTLDLSEPEFEVIDTNGVILENNTKINTGFYVTWIDDTYTVYLNNNPYVKNTEIDSAKEHNIMVINQAGTIVEYTISISYKKPTATIYTYDNQVINSGSKTNQKFYMTWTDDKSNRYTCLINDKTYSNGNVIKIDGNYEFKLTDEYGNTTTYSIIRDTIAPEGNLNGVTNGGITNNNVQFTSLENEVYIYLNNLIYVSGTEISEEGLHEIIIYDYVGNSNVYTFEIDKTAPSFDFSINPNENGYINQRTSITWDETSCSATLNGNYYISGNKIYDGDYIFKLVDPAGNVSESIFFVDSSTPIITITGIDIYGNSNTSVNITWTGNYEVKVNDIIIENNTTFDSDGKYNVLVTSLAGNIKNYTFEISTIPPTGILNGVSNGSSTKDLVTFMFDESTCSATLNGKIYSSNKNITSEGFYTIVLTDKFTNSNAYTFEIDKTAPSLILHGVSNGKSTKDNVIATWEEANCKTYLNNELYILGTEISEEGLHEIIIYDYVGNSNVYTFEIDKTAPSFDISGLKINNISNETVYINFNELGSSAFLNGKNYSSGYPIKNEGLYDFMIQDSLGNVALYTFEIDKTGPEYKIYSTSGNILEANTITNTAFFVTWEEANCKVFVNDTEYQKYEITEDGEYIFHLYDFLGNTTVFSIIIDHTLPIATFIGVEAEGITNSPVSIYFDSPATATLNGYSYSSGKTIYSEGKYQFVITNEIGNSNVYTFEIDITAPELTSIEGLNEKMYSNTDVYFFYDEKDATATLNDKIYYSGVPISEEGKYQFVLSDLVGNKTIIDFEIILTGPEGNLNGVTNGGFTNKSVTFTWDNPLFKATLNDLNYTNGSTIKGDGKYNIILFDLAGNSNTYTFEISTTKPVATFKGLNDNFMSNSSVSIIYSNCEVLVNNELYDNQPISSPGIYITQLTDKYGNSNVYTFEIDKTAPSFNLFGVTNDGFTNQNCYITWEEANCKAYLNNVLYSSGTSIRVDGKYIFDLIDSAGNISSCSFEKSSQASEGTLNAEFYFENYTNKSVTFTWDIEGSSATLNGLEYISGSEIFEDGEYIIQFKNKYGNIKNYSFIIDTVAPECILQGVDNNGFTNQRTAIISNELYLQTYVNGVLLNKNYITAASMADYNGIYNVEVYDQAGNSVTYTFEYYYENLKEYLFIESNEDNSSATISYNGDYQLIIDGIIVESGTTISEEGLYEIILQDKYGNQYLHDLSLDKANIPNYSFSNIATVIVIIFISLFILYVIVKRVKGQTANPYKKKK